MELAAKATSFFGQLSMPILAFRDFVGSSA
jgi:hypothetical protein